MGSTRRYHIYIYIYKLDWLYVLYIYGTTPPAESIKPSGCCSLKGPKAIMLAGNMKKHNGSGDTISTYAMHSSVVVVVSQRRATCVRWTCFEAVILWQMLKLCWSYVTPTYVWALLDQLLINVLNTALNVWSYTWHMNNFTRCVCAATLIYMIAIGCALARGCEAVHSWTVRSSWTNMRL